MQRNENRMALPPLDKELLDNSSMIVKAAASLMLLAEKF